MKKTVLILSSLLCLAACNKNLSPELTPAGENDVIVFGVEGVAVDMATKAVIESTAAQLQTNGFNVAGVTSNNATIFNAKATWVAQKSYYTTATPYYYPVSGTTNFYAVYPTSQAVSISAGVATVEYTNDNNTDLVAAKATGVSKPATATSVALAFDHILSQVSITAKGKTEGLDYAIKSIKITSPASGTYKYADNSWTLGATSSVVYHATETTVGTEATAIGVAQTKIPSNVTITVEYDVLQGGVVLASYAGAAAKTSSAVSVAQGKKSTINLTLPYSNADDAQITFTVTVNPWGEESHDVELQ